MKLEFCGLYCKYLKSLLGQGPRHPLSITWGRETVSCYSNVAFKSPAIIAMQIEVGFPDSSAGKKSTRNAGDPSLIPGLGRPPRRRAWQRTPVFLLGESPWTEEPGELQAMRSQRIGHNRATKHRYKWAGSGHSLIPKSECPGKSTQWIVVVVVVVVVV